MYISITYVKEYVLQIRKNLETWHILRMDVDVCTRPQRVKVI